MFILPTDNKPSPHNAHNAAMERWLRGVPVDEKTIEIVSENMYKILLLITSFDLLIQIYRLLIVDVGLNS